MFPNDARIFFGYLSFLISIFLTACLCLILWFEWVPTTGLTAVVAFAAAALAASHEATFLLGAADDDE